MLMKLYHDRYYRYIPSKSSKYYIFTKPKRVVILEEADIGQIKVLKRGQDPNLH